MYAMEKRAVNKTTVKWMSEMLGTRTVKTNVGNQPIPSGSLAASPLLWSLIVGQLLNDLTDIGINCIGYADDIDIIARDKCEGIICDIIQRCNGASL